ncbi:cupin domain-containing protein [Phyllobacterium sp. YR531]|uniref:cupin domain-containing protein n=1 Tax=Phyllobacterium sp. YR531 TaxID=1144343 RepID=UPI00026FC321|nr:cupin domain-containing protein [Phyllobacterium sp. YR531]EJN06818.1 cupin domain-containing protein [Phyllobacterium sp. YR531]
MSKFDSSKVPRRIVTGVKDGKSAFVSDGPVANAHHYASIPGMMTSVVYATAASPALPQGEGESAPLRLRVPPAAGETRLMIVTFPPDSSFLHPDFDPLAADREQREFIPGLAERFEPDAPGMHQTDTVDYDIVLDGEIWLELDDGATRHLRTGDVVIQCGTRHAWRNKGDHAATMCFVLIGAKAA